MQPIKSKNAFAARHLSLAALILAGIATTAQAADPAPSPDHQDWDIKYQSTYNWQKHPAFESPYSSFNSLHSGAEKMYTFSATAHLGARVWQGGEVYLNVEAVQGVPFTGNLVGLGGFTNGEITRAAGTEISVYRQRLFLRQTWNQGGGSEKVISDVNQLAGSVDKNRTVLTIGNFSILDVFDDNTYAKDPRTQFMNWGNWTYAAWDYAADARGFGWGAAAEWYRGDWVFRAARMTAPKDPNGLQVDYDLTRHFGDQVEVEHAHTLAGRPGKVRVLAFRNRAVVASFSDATRYLLANPGTMPQTIFNVRDGEKIKYGLGINVEQALSNNVGVFFRAMKTDGRTETLAFTEVDDSLSAGVMVQGAAWKRPEDVAGFSLGANYLSADRRRFLQAGGLSFFIGDGALSYKPEAILETFYNLAFYKHNWLTLDFQRVQNPAYNSARGPVNIFAVRWHAEF